MKLFSLTLILLICSTHKVHASNDIELYKAVYKGKYSGLNVTTTRRVNYNPQNRLFTLDTEAKALFAKINESTSFSLQDKHIKPLIYQYKRSVFGKKKRQSLFFDWKNRTVLGEKNGERHNKPLIIDKNTLDEPTFQLQLQIDAKHTTSLSQRLDYHYVKPFKHKHTTFFNHGLTPYTFKKQKTTALKYSTDIPATLNVAPSNKSAAPDDKDSTAPDDKDSTGAQNPDKTIHVWLLPEYNHVIAKIEFIDKNDDNYVLELSDYTFNSDKIHLITP